MGRDAKLGLIASNLSVAAAKEPARTYSALRMADGILGNMDDSCSMASLGTALGRRSSRFSKKHKLVVCNK